MKRIRESISDDLNNASKELQKESKSSKAKAKQNSAAKKMKELEQEMKERKWNLETKSNGRGCCYAKTDFDNLLAFFFFSRRFDEPIQSFKRVAPSFNKI
jgi:hypothetical protein